MNKVLAYILSPLMPLFYWLVEVYPFKDISRLSIFLLLTILAISYISSFSLIPVVLYILRRFEKLYFHWFCFAGFIAGMFAIQAMFQIMFLTEGYFRFQPLVALDILLIGGLNGVAVALIFGLISGIPCADRTQISEE